MRTRVPEYDEVPPDAPSLVNSMCASGYDLESAVADINDNSISAKSSSVRIIVNEDGASSWIAIVDDGRGMEDATLRKAMTFGCIDPAAPRDPDDQGHRIKIGGLGRMANSAFGGKLNLCGTCSHLFTMFMVYLVVDNKYNVYVR